MAKVGKHCTTHSEATYVYPDDMDDNRSNQSPAGLLRVNRCILESNISGMDGSASNGDNNKTRSGNN